MFHIKKSDIKLLLSIYGLVAVYETILLAVIIFFRYFSFDKRVDFINRVNPLTNLFHWDSNIYLGLVANGYAAAVQTVFFPLYIMCVNIMDLIVGNLPLAGLLVSWLSLGGAIYYFYKLLLLDYRQDQAGRIIVIMLVFPVAVFFSLIYTESLFLFVSLAAWYYLRRRRYLRSAIFVALAVMTRSVGIFLWPIYLLGLWRNEYGDNWRDWWRKHWLKAVYGLLPILSLSAWMMFCWLRFGDPLTFVKMQSAWAQWRHFSWPWLIPRVIADNVKHSVSPYYTFFRLAVVEGGSYLLLLITACYFLIKKEWPYAIYCALPLLLFSFFAPFYSVNRFIIVIFPIYIFLAKLLAKNDAVFYLAIMAGVTGLIFNYYLFINNGWIG